MQINVSQLITEPVGSERDYQVNDTFDILDNGNTIMIKGDIKLTHTNRSILVKGKLNMLVDLACARCLNEFDHPLTLSFEEEYFPINDRDSGGIPPTSDDTDLFMTDDDQVIDLTEAIRQYTLIALPMKPLCRQDCSGLSTSV
jgi:uncharacterized protein